MTTQTATMTVHNWLASFAPGESRRIPDNCTGHDLKDYAASRFGYHMSQTGNTIKRACPVCSR